MSGRTTRPDARQDAGQPSGAGAPDEPKQKRLGLIVGAVADGNHLGPEAVRRVFQECVPRGARRVLHRAPLVARQRPHVAAPDFDRQVERRRHRAAERFVRVRVGAAELVVEVREAGNQELAVRLELEQQVHERDRIGPARQRHDDAPAARDERVPPNGPKDAGGEGHGQSLIPNPDSILESKPSIAAATSAPSVADDVGRLRTV